MAGQKPKRLHSQDHEAALAIHILAVLDCENIQPFRADPPIENSIRPDSVGPHIVFLDPSFEGFAFKGILGEVAEGFFNSLASNGFKSRQVFHRLGCEADLFH